MSLLIWMISFIFSLIHTTGFIPKTTTMFFMANTKYCRNGRSTEKQKEKVSHVKITPAVNRYPRNRLSFSLFYSLVLTDCGEDQSFAEAAEETPDIG